MLRQIRYFQAIARLGNFSEAAAECYISQSAISQQLQALEQELGIKLIDRSKRRINLTPAGEFFYKKSLVIVSDFDKLCRETFKIANKDIDQLRIGFVRSYGGSEFQSAFAAFADMFPDIDAQVVVGNHEELYNLIRLGGIDISFNDQRRAFSDNYINLELVNADCFIEIAGGHPFAAFDKIEISDLKETPCILIASTDQQDNEYTYYHEIVGFDGEFLFAENIDEARMMLIGRKGFMPVEGGITPTCFGSALRRVPLYRNDKRLRRKYCAFWKADNYAHYIDKFAELLRSQFNSQNLPGSLNLPGSPNLPGWQNLPGSLKPNHYGNN